MCFRKWLLLSSLSSVFELERTELMYRVSHKSLNVFSEAVLRSQVDLRWKKSILGETLWPLKITKETFCEIKHGLTMTSDFWKLKYSWHSNTYFMASNTLDHEAIDKGIIEAMTIKFSEIFAISMLKNHKKIVGLAWLIGRPHPLLKIVWIFMGHPAM